MAQYSYDEGGGMATYFIMTILALVLTPLTILSVRKKSASASLILLFILNVMFSTYNYA